jgi:hypothetical protein
MAHENLFGSWGAKMLQKYHTKILMKEGDDSNKKCDDGITNTMAPKRGWNKEEKIT